MQVVTLRIPKVLHEKLKSLARRKGLSLNALIVNALWELEKGENYG